MSRYIYAVSLYVNVFFHKTLHTFVSYNLKKLTAITGIDLSKILGKQTKILGATGGNYTDESTGVS